MRNKNFQKNDHAILVAYCNLRNRHSVKKITHHAKISRSTFYRHHRKTHDILFDHEEALYSAYQRAIEESISVKPDEKVLYLKTLVFISSHKVVFRALFKNGRKETIKKMLAMLRPYIIIHWSARNNNDKLYNIYENEILGVIEYWGNRYDFEKSKIDKTLRDILYLTRTAPRRLGAIIGRHHL